MKKYSIFICTRNRTILLNKALQSISKNTGNKKLIEVLIAVDEDDQDTIFFVIEYKTAVFF